MQTRSSTARASIFPGFGDPWPEEERDTHLDLPRADVELLQNVDEEVLNFHPGVDAVGAVQDDDDVHVGLAPWGVGTRSWLPRDSVLSGSGSPGVCPGDNRRRTLSQVCNSLGRGAVIPWASCLFGQHE